MCTIRLTPRKASRSEDFPSLWPPTATISGMGKLSPKATAAACRRLQGGTQVSRSSVLACYVL